MDLINRTFILSIFFLAGCATQNKSGVSGEEQVPVAEETHSTAKEKLERGFVRKPEVMLNHEYFIVSYNKEQRLANYVEYNLTRKDIENSKFERRDNFHSDPKLKELGLDPVVPKDYLKSGYDMGHLAPAEDFTFSQKAVDTTFVMSNMTPQKPKLNRHAWARLEARVRRWACGEEKISVISGPILESNLPKLKETISIPKRFFKAVLDETRPYKAICFIYDQSDEKDIYKERATSVAACERAISIPLFVKQNIKPEIKNKFNLADWKEENCKKN